MDVIYKDTPMYNEKKQLINSISNYTTANTSNQGGGGYANYPGAPTSYQN